MTPLVVTLTVENAAELLRCSQDQVRELACSGRLAGIKPGRDWVFPFDAFMRSLNLWAEEVMACRRRESDSTPTPTAVVPAGMMTMASQTLQ